MHAHGRREGLANDVNGLRSKLRWPPFVIGNDFVDDWKALIVPARHPLAQFHTKFWGVENTEGNDIDPCGYEVQRDVTIDKTQRNGMVACGANEEGAVGVDPSRRL
jgi:hypothetical protein